MCASFDVCFFFFFKQKTAYEMRISDWSSDVCSSDLFHRLAVPQQPHHLHQLDVEARPSPGQRLHRGDDPLDRAGMVRAPDVDQRVGALGLLVMIGEVGAEIGPLPVRLPYRPILVVAETRRTEQHRTSVASGKRVYGS